MSINFNHRCGHKPKNLVSITNFWSIKAILNRTRVFYLPPYRGYFLHYFIDRLTKGIPCSVPREASFCRRMSSSLLQRWLEASWISIRKGLCLVISPICGFRCYEAPGIITLWWYMHLAVDCTRSISDSTSRCCCEDLKSDCFSNYFTDYFCLLWNPNAPEAGWHVPHFFWGTLFPCSQND